MALTDEQKMQIIKEATASGYKGSFQELFDQQEAAMAPEQSAQPMEQMPEQPMQPPMQTGDMPSMQQMQDGDLVQSYASEAPGIGNMPMGEDVGTILESASTYKEGGFKGIKYADKYSNGGPKKSTASSVTPYDMDYVTYGSKEYNKAYKQGKIASTSYDDKGEVTLNMQMLPEAVIEADRDAPLTRDQQAEYNKFLLDSSSGTKAMRRGEELTDDQIQAANYLTKVNPVAANIYRGSDFSDMAESFGYGAVTSPIGGTGFLGTTGTALTAKGAALTSKYAPKATQLLKKTFKFDPSSTFGAAYNLPKQIIQKRGFDAGLKAYRTGLKGKTKLGTTGNVLKETVGGVHTLAVPSYLKDVANVKEDALQGGLSATELVKVANPYLNLAVNTTKATKDFQKGNYVSGALRVGSTLTDKYLPKSFVAKVLDPEQTKSLTKATTKTLDLFRKAPSNLKKTGILPANKED